MKHSLSYSTFDSCQVCNLQSTDSTALVILTFKSPNHFLKGWKRRVHEVPLATRIKKIQF